MWQNIYILHTHTLGNCNADKYFGLIERCVFVSNSNSLQRHTHTRQNAMPYLFTRIWFSYLLNCFFIYLFLFIFLDYLCRAIVLYCSRFLFFFIFIFSFISVIAKYSEHENRNLDRLK